MSTVRTDDSKVEDPEKDPVTEAQEEAKEPGSEDDPKDQEDSEDQEDPEDSGEQEQDQENEDELPKWVRERLSKANAEAANYRVKLRNAEKALEEAGNVAEMQEALEQYKAANAELEHQILVTAVARQFNLPDELAEVLKGSTKEELEAHAEKLKRFAPEQGDDPTPRTKVEDLTGGLDPSDDEDFDPVAIARKNRRRR